MTVSERSEAVDYYNRDAADFAVRYNSVSFEAVHPLLARYLPVGGAALDIGAGSGRDARALAAHGLDVTAIEPSVGLRSIGVASASGIRWIDDRLPDLARITDSGRFDLILCSAVLMLVPPTDLTKSFMTMAELLAPSGRIAVNVRQPMSGEPPDIFFAHSDDEILAAVATAGLVCLDRAEARDALGRKPYRWRSFILERRR